MQASAYSNRNKSNHLTQIVHNQNLIIITSQDCSYVLKLLQISRKIHSSIAVVK